ncbi:unnamed protein product [Aphis gossypii]|uniref:Uncharacterized protein n=1 Tax=Aphis gossypii TaxID=80765 RepID=A0A9P0J7N2_APHGO|nr:unnamed protein product [Aphis gossypii]
MCNPFLQGLMEYKVGDETVFGGLIFVNIELLRNYLPFMRRSSVIIIDGTFGILPRIPRDMEQLVTIPVLLDNISFPIVYAILNQRTYSRLWKFLRNELPFDLLNWQGIQVITDYETTLKNATRRVLPKS